MTRFVRFAFVLTALPFAALPRTAAAQDIDCANAQAQVELTFCAEQDWNAADADLNAAYEVAISAMKGIDINLDAPDRGAEKALRASQRAWITCRDNTCAAEGWAFHGGSAEPMIIYQCRARVSATRAEELANMAAGD
jgi:uncharacterized protein YecT (DUF1311 family)